jgi:hypothetical protein
LTAKVLAGHALKRNFNILYDKKSIYSRISSTFRSSKNAKILQYQQDFFTKLNEALAINKADCFGDEKMQQKKFYVGRSFKTSSS